ncbi:acyltransferase family protein [Maricaulis parjimensis]|uniref:acyltransferase family protein n=1 Tax=Maricaulis parjimensis TaxID=144023 RepID=UPI001939CF21|nr:acyltransferase [Maricaulis parjimensis]
MGEHGQHKTLIEIQFLRAIAVLMVVVAHVHQANDRFFETPVLGQASLFGFAGVDVFFVLSGFIIHYIYRAHRGFDAHYFLNRMNRVLPLYWIFTGFAVAGYFAMGDSLTRSRDELDLIGSLTLIPTGQTPILPVGWTLTHELYFYLVYGLGLLLPRSWRGWAAALWAVSSLAYILAPHTIASAWLDMMFSPFNFLFLAGIGLAALLPVMARLRIVAPLVLAAGLAGGLVWTHFNGIDGLAAAPERVAVLAPFAIGLVATFLAWSPRFPALLARIGDWSYAIYLSHILVISVLARIVPDLIGGSLLAGLAFHAICLIACLILGGLTHVLLERPLLNRGKAMVARLAPKRERTG